MKNWLLLLAFPTSLALAQSPWSVPVVVTHGPGNDLHPALANGPAWLYQKEELLAFSRDGLNIGVLSTTGMADRWDSVITWITSDSAHNDHPSGAWARFGGVWADFRPMLLWQSRKNGNLDIYYSKRDGLGWTIPLPLTLDPGDDRHPSIAPRDSGYYAVWERDGQILFAEYSNDEWSPHEFVTLPGDTLNCFPDVVSASWTNFRMVVWQRRKSTDTTFAVMYSVRVGGTWSTPDTVAYTGDNINPKFFRSTADYWQGATVGWARAQGGTYQIVGREAYVSQSGSVQWQPTVALPSAAGNNYRPVFNGYLIISVEGANRPTSGRRAKDSFFDLWYSGGIWMNDAGPTGGTQMMGVSDPFFPQAVVVATDSLGSNRHPTIGTGIFRMDGARVWSVWESIATGEWKLQGSYTEIGFLGVASPVPHSFHLSQNYPNPFNPTTRIRFALDVPGLTLLKIFDVLGRERATLVDEHLDPGRYEITWDASGFPSGVYYYRLSMGNSSETKKLMLIR